MISSQSRQKRLSQVGHRESKKAVKRISSVPFCSSSGTRDDLYFIDKTLGLLFQEMETKLTH